MQWKKKWQPTPVFSPGESQGQRNLVDCHLWGHTESDTTEVTYQKEQQLLILEVYCNTEGLPRWLSGKESACQCRRYRFDPWVGMISWRRKWLPTPVFLPGEFHGWRSLAGYNPWGQPRTEQARNTEPSSLQDDMWQAIGCTSLQSPFLTRRLRS